MGTIKKGVNGPFKGKAGSVVGSTWKKTAYIKGLPRNKGAKRLPSPEQSIQQQKFKLLNGFLGTISKMLEIGFKQFTANVTGANAAFSLNYDHAFIPHGDDFSLNYSALQLSHGSLVTAGLEKAWLENGGVAISWNTKTYGMGGEMDDIAYVLAYNPSTTLFFTDAHQATRFAGTTHIDLRGQVHDGQLHVWLFFADKQQKRVSRTVYIPLSSNET